MITWFGVQGVVLVLLVCPFAIQHNIEAVSKLTCESEARAIFLVCLGFEHHLFMYSWKRRVQEC